MYDREKVIKGLEILHANSGCIAPYDCDCKTCPYERVNGCIEAIIEDALALLKTQEPRVMTLEEVKQERICWVEDEDDGMEVRLFPATMFGIGEYANGSRNYMFLAQKPWAIDENDCEWWYLIEDYGQTWRCWTSRPTDEQRRETPWILAV